MRRCVTSFSTITFRTITFSTFCLLSWGTVTTCLTATYFQKVTFLAAKCFFLARWFSPKTCGTKEVKRIVITIKKYVQLITKKHIPPVFQPFVFPVYLRNHLRYNKSVYIFLHPFLESFQLEQEFFKYGDKISWYLQKR